MVCSLFAIIAAGAGSVLAMTPQGFVPGSQTPLFVLYSNSIQATNGAVMSKASTTKPPLIGTEQRLLGQSYAVMMIDLDIPRASPPQTDTLLHWMQTDLVPASTPTLLNTTMGRQNIFLLENSKMITPAAEYFGPSPPARTPLSHRYAQVLIDTSTAGSQAISSLSRAALNRQGFNAGAVLASAGVTQDKVVAGNFFMVTNPGPAQSNTGLGPGNNGGAPVGPQPAVPLVGGGGAGAGTNNGTAPGTVQPLPAPAVPAAPGTTSLTPLFPGAPAPAPQIPGAAPGAGVGEGAGTTTPGSETTTLPVTAGASLTSVMAGMGGIVLGLSLAGAFFLLF